jgi:nonsense-mediated mRNA decay protein 3
MKTRFCPNCGATNRPFVRGLCVDCFITRNQLVSFPKEIGLKRCRECAKTLLNGKWLAASLEHLVTWAKGKIAVRELENVRFLLEPREEGAMVWVEGKIVGEIEETLVERPVQFPLKMVSSLCPDCSKLSANYYEAVLQLRFETMPKKEWSEVLAIVRETVQNQYHHDSLARITNTVQLKNGFDVYIGSKRAGKTVSEKVHQTFGGQITRSFSLAGVDKSGKTRKRFTFLVRI